MRKLLAACLFSLALFAGAAVQASAQDSAADKTKDAAVDAKDATVKGTKKTGNWVKRTWHKIF